MPDPAPSGPDRIPHDLDAERAALGACLLSGQAVVSVRATLSDPAPFWAPRHAAVWSAIVALADRGEPVDPLTVLVELGPDRLDSLDAGFLADLQLSAPGTVNAGTYATVVEGHARRRRIIELGLAIGEAARSNQDPGLAVLDARTHLDALGRNLAGGSHLRIADLAAMIAGAAPTIEPTLLHRTDGQALLYPGAMHAIQGPPSTGKSWVAMIAVAQILDMGGSAIWLDWEDSPPSVLARMLALGIDTDAIVHRFTYARLEGGWTAAEHAHLVDLLDALNPDLVVLDGIAAALAQDQLDENVAADVMSWIVRVPTPIVANGAAALMLDHTRKDIDKGERYARGSGAKLAAIDGAAYLLTVSQAFSRTTHGTLGLTITKDRHGGVGAVGETAAVVTMRASDGGRRMDARVTHAPETRTAEGTWRPTIVMDRVARLLSSKPLTEREIRDRLARTSAKDLTTALAVLQSEGWAVEKRDPDGTRLLHVVRPFDPSAPPPGRPDPTEEEF